MAREKTDQRFCSLLVLFVSGDLTHCLFFLLTEQFRITFNLWFLDFKSFEVVCLLQKVRVLVLYL